MGTLNAIYRIEPGCPLLRRPNQARFVLGLLHFFASPSLFSKFPDREWVRH